MYSVENTKGMCQHLYKLSQIVIQTLCIFETPLPHLSTSGFVVAMTGILGYVSSDMELGIGIISKESLWS